MCVRTDKDTPVHEANERRNDRTKTTADGKPSPVHAGATPFHKAPTAAFTTGSSHASMAFRSSGDSESIWQRFMKFARLASSMLTTTSGVIPFRCGVFPDGV